MAMSNTNEQESWSAYKAIRGSFFTILQIIAHKRRIAV
jgi:hypothetical protein